MTNDIVKKEENALTPIQQIDSDFKESRDNIKEVIENSKHAAKDVADLAYQSQAPRFYEALDRLLRTQLEASRELASLHKTKKEVEGRVAQKQAGDTINNNLILTSTEILELLHKNDIKEIK